MAILQAEIETVLELFAPVGAVTAKRMMGGLAVFSHGNTFAMYDPDQGCFLKTDDKNRGDFEAENLPPFTFKFKNGKTGTMKYHALPERCYDDPDELKVWALKSVEVALRAAHKKTQKSRRPNSKA